MMLTFKNHNKGCIFPSVPLPTSMWLTPTQAAAEMINTSWCDLVCNAGAIKTRLLIDNGSKKPEMPAVDYFIRRGSKVAATGRTIWFNYAFACNWGIEA